MGVLDSFLNEEEHKSDTKASETIKVSSDSKLKKRLSKAKTDTAEEMSEEEEKLLLLESKKRKYKDRFGISIVFLIVVLVIVFGFNNSYHEYRSQQNACYDSEVYSRNTCEIFEERNGNLSNDELSVLKDKYQSLLDLSKLLAFIIFSGAGFLFVNLRAIQNEIKAIENRIQKIKSEKRSSEKGKKVATEKAEYKTKQLEKATNLKDKGGIENLEKALEILKNYE